MTEPTIAATLTTSRPARYEGAAPGQPTLDTWQDPPHNRWAFAHVAEMVPSMPIRRGHPQGEHAGLGVLTDPLGDLEARLAASYTDGFVVYQGGAVIAEHYREGFGPADPHLLMSASKSICGLTVGTLVDDGLVSTSERVESYVPELAGTAYGDATVQHVLDMTVDVDYDEDYRSASSEVQAQDRVAGWRTREPGDLADTYEFLTSLRGGGRHGEVFRYRSAGTDVLAWVIESVTGRRYADAVAERLWSRLGCAHDASITVDAAGFGFANGGISCTARDLGRVGQLLLDGGLVDGVRVVSADWVRGTLAGGDRDAAAGTVFQRVHPRGSYRNQWWSTGDEHGSVFAVGIYGQYVWVDPVARAVVVKLSSCPVPVTEEWNRLHRALFRDVCGALPAL